MGLKGDTRAVSAPQKLAAILAAEVAGYSRLMGADEVATRRVLRENRAAVDPVAASHGGRIVKTTGDGVLLELGKVVISRRERIVMLEPFEQGLMATTLRYGYEIRDAKPYFEDIPSLKLPDEMVKLAEHILDTKSWHFDPAEFEDRYENAVVEMLKQKQAGMPVKKEAPVAAPSTVINLMDALRRSIQKEQPAVKKGKAVEKVGRQSGKRKAG